MGEPLPTLRVLHAQLAELVRAEDKKRKRSARRRGKQAAFAPPSPPGPQPTELDIARAKRLLRRLG